MVDKLVPFHCTTEPLMKLLPLTVRVKAEPPAVAEVGLMLVVAGTGFVAAALIVKVCALEAPPPGAGLNTVTEAVPAVAMSAAVIAAVSWVEDRYVVVRLDPFHCTTEPLMKLLPLTVRVKAEPPAVAEVGLMLVVVGTGLAAALIVKVCALEAPPPGAGLNTVTEAVPAVAMSVAVIAAVNWIADTYVVVRLDPFHCTTEPLMKLLPLTVRVKAEPPAVAEVGLMLVVVGTGLAAALIVKVCAFEVPPPGAGLNTVTEAVPVVAMSAAVIAAVNWIADTYVVVRLDPFHCTTEPLMKLLPLTVRVKAEPPAVAEVGLMLVVVGTGLAAALIVKVCAFEVPPPGAGLNTVTEAVPAVAMSVAVIGAVNWVADTYVVVRLDPFHCTTEPLMKLLPLTVRVKAEPPAVAEVGLMLVVAGTGLLAVPVADVYATTIPIRSGDDADQVICLEVDNPVVD